MHHDHLHHPHDHDDLAGLATRWTGMGRASRAAFGEWPHMGFGPGRNFGGGRRARRGDVRAALLALLGERSMHGYEVISELAERTGGAWRPSPGSIYPTLQLLEDEELVSSIDDGGKRRYSLTDAGRNEVESRRDRPAPWEEITKGLDPSVEGLRESAFQLFAALAQVGRAGTRHQREQAEQLLSETRRKLYGLLAETPEHR